MSDDDRKDEPEPAGDETPADGDDLESTQVDDEEASPSRASKDDLESTQVDDDDAPAADADELESTQVDDEEDAGASEDLEAMRADAKERFAEALAADDDGAEDSEPQPVAAPDTDPGSVAPSTPRPVWMTALQWVLPVVLAGAAVGVHWWLNVPEEIAVSNGDQGAATNKPPRKRARRASGRRYEVRDPRQLARDFKRWKRVDFEGEPVHGKWARAYQSLISRAVVIARQAAFEGAPAHASVNVVLAECRTVRCRFLLRTPHAHELPLVDAALSRLEDKNGKVWRTYESKPIDPPEEMPADQSYYEVMVSWTSDEIDSASLTVPPAPEGGGGGGVGKAAASGGADSGAAGGSTAAIEGGGEPDDDDEENDED